MSLKNARRTWERLRTADLPGYVDPAIFKLIRDEFQNVFEELDYLRGVVSGIGQLGATSMSGALYALGATFTSVNMTTLTATHATFSGTARVGGGLTVAGASTLAAAAFSGVVSVGNATTSGTTSSAVRVTMTVNGQVLYLLASTT